MHQAIHILIKDIHYLRREICVFLSILGVFTWVRGHYTQTDPTILQILLVVTGFFLIGRVVHAEAIPGERQFWLTRPYRRGSLFLAKLGFILLMINLPILCSQVIIVLACGFPPTPALLAGLAWSQLVVVLCLSIPVAAVASITSGVVGFACCLLAIAATGYWALQILAVDAYLGPVEWVRNTAAGVLVFVAALAILGNQYWRRKTLESWAMAIVGAAGVLLSAIYLPWPVVMGVQTRMSGGGPVTPLPVSVEAAPKRFYTLPHAPTQVELGIAMRISGVPCETLLRPDYADVYIDLPNGAQWHAEGQRLNRPVRISCEGDSSVFSALAWIKRDVFTANRDSLVTIRGSLYVTELGKPRSRTVVLSSEPVSVFPDMQCFTGVLGDVICRSPIQWPGGVVTATLDHSVARPLTTILSYSPFPGLMQLDPIETRWVSAPALGPSAAPLRVTLEVKEPVAHFRRDFESRSLRLVDVAVPYAKRYIIRDGKPVESFDY